MVTRYFQKAHLLLSAAGISSFGWKLFLLDFAWFWKMNVKNITIQVIEKSLLNKVPG